MRKSLVLTVIGDDRPRIVEALAEQILAAGANWEESQMAHVAGKFAGLLRVSVEEDRAGELSARLRTIADGLTVVVEEAGGPPAVEGRPLRLELVGNDRPGIVRDISRALAAQHINIESLETGVESAPMTGDLLFRASALVRVPPTVTLDALRGELEALADELMVDLDVVHEDES